MIKTIYKCLILLIIFLSLGIVCKENAEYRDKVHYYLYEDNLAFSNFRNFYNKYLGDIFPLNYMGNETISVFSDGIQYSSISKYLDGYSLKVNSNYLVPAIKGGIVTYVGDKDDYGNVVIIMGDDGVSIWYGNIKNHNLKLYDSVNSGDFIGEVNDEVLYLVFYDEDEFLEYDSYMN